MEWLISCGRVPPSSTFTPFQCYCLITMYTPMARSFTALQAFLAATLVASIAAQHVSLFQDKTCTDTAVDFDLGTNAHGVCSPTPSSFVAVKNHGGLQQWDCIWMCTDTACKQCLEVYSTIPDTCSNTYYQNDGKTPLTYNAILLQEC